jgi:hypothetical protein
MSLQSLHPKRVLELGLIFYPVDGGLQRVPPRHQQIYARLNGVITAMNILKTSHSIIKKNSNVRHQNVV